MDAQKLLERFLGPGSLSQQTQRAKDMLGGSGQGGLGDLMGRMPGGALGGLAAGGLLGVLLGGKSARKMAGGLVGLGAAAALGALAHRALSNWQAGRDAAAAPVATATDAPRLLPAQAADGAPFALALVKAMIAAANADGHIGPEEHKQIFDAATRAGFDAETKAFLFDALSNPPGPREIAAMAGGMEQAAELYLAARLAIDPDHPAETAFLQSLAQAMNLPPDFVAHLERQATGAAG